MIHISPYTKALNEGIHYCVYKFLDKNDNVLYVGKSKQFKMRIFNHLRDNTHLPKECISKINKIEFLDFIFECDMDIYEIYCINYYNPPYNIDTKSGTGLIKINIPKLWNELDIETFEEIRPSKDADEFIKKELNIQYFNERIFLNDDLTTFLKEHYGKKLNKDDINSLEKICSIPISNIETLNNYIAYNESRAELINENGEITLIKRKKGRPRYGSLIQKEVNNNLYLCLKIKVDETIHSFYGKSRKEIVDKMYDYKKL